MMILQHVWKRTLSRKALCVATLPIYRDYMHGGTFFSLYVFGESEVPFRNFFLCCPSQRSARSQVPSPGGNLTVVEAGETVQWSTYCTVNSVSSLLYWHLELYSSASWPMTAAAIYNKIDGSLRNEVSESQREIFNFWCYSPGSQTPQTQQNVKIWDSLTMHQLVLGDCFWTIIPFETIIKVSKGFDEKSTVSES